MTKEIQNPKSKGPARSVIGNSDFFRISSLVIRHSVPRPCFGYLDKLNFVAFRGIDERATAAVQLQVRAVGIFQPFGSEVFAEIIQAIDFEGKVRQIRL